LTASASLTSSTKLNKAAKLASLLNMLKIGIYVFLVVMSLWGMRQAGESFRCSSKDCRNAQTIRPARFQIEEQIVGAGKSTKDSERRTSKTTANV